MPRGAASRRTPAWTVLAYLAGDNDLAPEMIWSLQEMKRAMEDATTRRALRVAAELDPPGGGSKRYRFPGGASAAPVPRGGGLPLDRFLADSLREVPPSPHLAVVLSGHGSGAVGDFLLDLEPKSSLSLPRAAEVLGRLRARREGGSPIDLLGLDSCRMGTVELAYEVREHVRFLVASEGAVLDSGWPYHPMLRAIARAETVEAAAKACTESYLEFYRDYEVAGHSTDIAACALGRIEAVADALRALADALCSSLRRLLPDGLEEGVELGEIERDGESRSLERARDLRDALVLAHWSAQSYERDRYVDLLDFGRQLARYSRRRPGTGRLLALCRELVAAVESAVLTSGTTGPRFQHSHGLSIYFPWSDEDVLPEYGELAFAADTGWADFVELYVESTRRMRRRQGDHLSTTGGRPAALEPLARRPRPSYAGSETGVKDPEAGTHRDPESGTHRGGHRDCASTRNPPDGYYPRGK